MQRRRCVFVVSVGIALAVPLASWAQGAEGEGDGLTSEAAPTEYTVQPGDTLWDLCQRFLNNPWYWPKIWSYNPEITNPHWIYPGNRVRFYPGAGALPAQVEPVGEEEGEAYAGTEGPEELESFDDMAAFDEITEEDLFEAPEDIRAKLDISLSRSTPLRRKHTFVSEEELARAGLISGSTEEMEMLTYNQRVYLKLDSAGQPGQNFDIFRVVRELHHPVTGNRLGYVTQVLGRANIERMDGNVGIARINLSFEPILRGDRVGAPDDQRMSSVEQVANTKNLKGYIVATEIAEASFTGETYIVFVDLGRADGVQLGNTLTVVRAGDGYSGETDEFPDEDIGALQVVDTQANVSTALVTRSTRELFVGDRVEMRVE